MDDRIKILMFVRDSFFEEESLKELIYFSQKYLNSEENANLISRFISRKWNECFINFGNQNYDFIVEARKIFFKELDQSYHLIDVLNTFDDMILNQNKFPSLYKRISKRN